MEENFLSENEVLDDLQLNNLKIIQNKKDYRFSSDSVLLANFVKCNKTDFVVEFCSGSGVISILVNEKYHPKKIVGFEIQKNLCDMSLKSLRFNNIENISFYNIPLENATEKVGNGTVDVLICNPPYYELDENKQINQKFKFTKYEVLTSLESIFKSANKILKFGGKFFVVHVPSRLQEILYISSLYKFECKKLQLVYPNESKNSHLVLLEFTKGGNKGLDVLKPIILIN